MKNFYDRIREFRGKPVYEILAKTNESKGSFFVCYREHLDCSAKCRNLYFYPIGGYRVKGEPEKELYPCTLNSTPKIYQCATRTATEEDVAPLLKIKPEFKYIVKKMDIYLYDIFKIFRHWSKFPQMEILLNMKLPLLATNKSFFKLKEPRQKEILHYFKKNSHIVDSMFVTLQDITDAMKYGRTVDEIWEYRSNCFHKKEIRFPEWIKISPLGICEWDFINYRRRLKQYFPERLDEEYWTKFKNVHDFHVKENRTIKEVHNIIEAEERLRKAEQQKRIDEQDKKYFLAIKRKLNWDGTFNGLHVYIPKDLKDIKLQADALEQCLVACNYQKKVIEKKSTLIFIRDGETPIATAELDNKSKKIVQFYGNEMDRNNCLPPENAKIALDLFTNKFIRKSG